MKDALPEGHGLSDLVLASATLLPKVGDNPSITDAQFDSLSAGVARGQSVLVSAPTSTGKTLVGWWAISSALQAGGKAVYLVSHRALAKQKFEEAQRLFLGALGGDRTAIVLATGDGVEDASGRKTSAPMSATVLVATYEKFLGCLSTGGPPRDLTGTTFICDEVQLIGDKSRGQNVELLLTLMKRAGWRQLVGLSAVLSQNDAGALSDWLGLTLVRNPVREKALRIDCRTPTELLRVTAAPGRDGDILRVQEGAARDTNVIVSELLQEDERKPVIVFCMKVDDTYELAEAFARTRPPTRQFAIPQGVELDDRLEQLLKAGVAYHNAELSEDERLFVETQLAEGMVDVVYATTTLAAGVNFPLGSAVFHSWRRWNFDRAQHEPISRAEFQNMAGRVGRMGQAADEGRVILTADGAATALNAARLMDLRAQDELGKGITSSDFGALTLQLFAGRLCSTRDGAFDLISSTLSASREQDRNQAGLAQWRVDLDRQIDRLIEAECLIGGLVEISPTAFGLAVARSGLKPETALYFLRGLSAYGDALVELLPTMEAGGSEEDLSFVLAHAAIASPEFSLAVGGPATRHVSWRIPRPNLMQNPYARRRQDILFSQPWMGNVGAANGALLLAMWASGATKNAVEAVVPGVRLGTTQALARDVAWILTGVSEIVATVTAPMLADETRPEPIRANRAVLGTIRKLARTIRRQATRLNAGLPSDLLWLLGLELPARPRRLKRPQILALHAQGCSTPLQLMSGDAEVDSRRRLALAAVEQPAFANQVRDAARRWKQQDREHCKQAHERRARSLGIEGAITALYAARGDALEDAFGEALALAAIRFERLDNRNRQAHPDFLVTIEDYPSLVVEVKSRAADTDLVNLNSATEVLTASELIGLRDNFCITLCSPGVDPGVPALIESCGRLGVLEVADLSEAILRLREGTLTREDLYNWLTTPGMAAIDDLPHSS